MNAFRGALFLVFFSLGNPVWAENHYSLAYPNAAIEMEPLYPDGSDDGVKIVLKTEKKEYLLNLKVSEYAQALLPTSTQANVLPNTVGLITAHIAILDTQRLYILSAKKEKMLMVSHFYDMGPNGSRRFYSASSDGNVSVFIFLSSKVSYGLLVTEDDRILQLKVPSNYLARRIGRIEFPATVDGKIRDDVVSIDGVNLEIGEEIRPRIVLWSEIKAETDFSGARNAPVAASTDGSQDGLFKALKEIPFEDDFSGQKVSLADYIKRTYRTFSSEEISSDVWLDREQLDKALVGLDMSRSGGVAILGAAGTGKSFFLDTAIGYALSSPNVPNRIKERIYLGVQATDFASNGMVGRFETKVKALRDAARIVPLTLVIDEVHTLVGQGTHITQPNDFFEMLKEELGTGRIKIMGAATPFDFEILTKNRAIERRFPIRINYPEPDAEGVEKIAQYFIKHEKPDFEGKIGLDMIRAFYEIANQFNAIGANPDKTIVLIDSALSYARLKGIRVIDREFIMDWASQLYNYKVGEFTADRLQKKLKALRALWNSKIVGHDLVKTETYLALQDHFVALKNRRPRKPLSLLMLGDRGSGKTSFAGVVGEGLGMAVVRIMMSDYTGENSMDDLKERLGRTIRDNPFQIILLDEIEKCPFYVQNKLLDLLDSGRFETKIGPGEAKVVDSTRTIFMFGSNAGLSALKRHESIADIKEAAEVDGLSRYVIDRVNLITVFENMGGESLDKIIHQKLSLLENELTEIYPEKEIVIDPSIAHEVERQLGILGKMGVQMGFNEQKVSPGSTLSVRDLERVVDRIRRDLVAYFEKNVKVKKVSFGVGESGRLVVTNRDTCEGILKASQKKPRKLKT